MNIQGNYFDGTKPTERGAWSVDEFCKAHDFGRVKFYELLKEGRGPRIMKIGKRTLISVEAAAEWRRRMEQETEAL